MAEIKTFPSDKMSPQQSMLQAMDEVDEMEFVSIVYIRKGEDIPRLTCSSMYPKDMIYLGHCLLHYATGSIGEE